MLLNFFAACFRYQAWGSDDTKVFGLGFQILRLALRKNEYELISINYPRAYEFYHFWDS